MLFAKILLLSNKAGSIEMLNKTIHWYATILRKPLKLVWSRKTYIT